MNTNGRNIYVQVVTSSSYANGMNPLTPAAATITFRKSTTNERTYPLEGKHV